MKEIRWGFVGCGEVTERKSGPAFSKVEGSSVVAVMSRDADKARKYAERHGIARWYADAFALISDPQVNAVYIATPPSSHATYAIMAMKAGKPCYIEKPMCSTYEECTRVNRISQETGVPCFVAYYRRYLPYFMQVKQLLNNGTIGKVLNVQIRLIQPPRDMDYNSTSLPWRLQPDIAGGGYFYDLASHQIDLLQDLLGNIFYAEGFKANVGKVYSTAEDSVSACFSFESGIVGSGSWCFTAHPSAKEDRIEIIGDKGMIHFSTFCFDPVAVYTGDRDKQLLTVDNPQFVQEPLIALVVKHLQGGKQQVQLPFGEVATTTNWVMDKILGKL